MELKAQLQGLAVGIAVVFVGLTGCTVAGGGGGGGDGDGDGDGIVNFDASLSGDQEVPPVDTDATGSGDFALDPQTGMMTYSVTFSGLSGPVTAAHFHLAPAGQAGGVIINLSDDFVGDDDGSVQGTASFSDTQIAELQAGNVYINLHTAENPDGEIRGQLAEQ